MQSFLVDLLSAKKEPQQQQRPADVPPSPATVESGASEGGKKKDKVYLDEYPTDVNFVENPCLACLGSHEKIPAALQSKIDDGSMLGSVKPYSQHFMVCFGQGNSWPNSVEDSEGSFIADFQEALEDSKAEEKVGRIMLTAIDANVCFPELQVGAGGEEMVEVIHFPSFVSVKIDRKSMGKLIDFSTSDNFDLSILRNAPGVEVKSIRDRSFVLVCVHKLRDKRCGVIGPLLVDGFRKSIEKYSLEKKIDVVGVSHIGGHKWAGNVIIYSNKHLEKGDAVSENPVSGETAVSKSKIEGHWYGRVFPNHTDTVVEEHFLKGGVCKQLWRGRMDGCVMDW